MDWVEQCPHQNLGPPETDPIRALFGLTENLAGLLNELNGDDVIIHSVSHEGILHIRRSSER